jgi:hypothetical protein
MKSIVAIKKKRGRGRPKTDIGPTIGLRLYPSMEKQIDAWAATQADQPSKPEAIRRLLQLGLNVPQSGTARQVTVFDAPWAMRLADRIKVWAKEQPDKPALADAFVTIVETGLAALTAAKRAGKAK